MTTRRLRASLAACALAVLAAACGVMPASASAAPQWTSEVLQGPTNLPPGGRGMIRIYPENLGPDPSTGFPTISFQLPPGVLRGTPAPALFQQWVCSGVSLVTCTNPANASIAVPAHTYTQVSSAPRLLHVVVELEPAAPEGVHPFEVTLSGGGGAPATQVHSIRVDDEQLPFGITPGTFSAGFFDVAGNPEPQAGSHPDFRTSFQLNSRFVDPALAAGTGGAQLIAQSRAIPAQGHLKDVVSDLPPGFVGNPNAVPECPNVEDVQERLCPPDTQVGLAKISPPFQVADRMYAIYNIAPRRDTPAQFAFTSPVGPVVLTPVLRSDGDLGLSAQVRNLTEADEILASQVTLWGVPADPVHDAQRCPRPSAVGEVCAGIVEWGGRSWLDGSEPDDVADPHASDQPRRPFLTAPTSCTAEAPRTAMHVTSWDDPGAYEPDGDPDLSDPSWVSEEAALPATTGCELLPFAPSIGVTPTAAAADAPSGLDLELDVPQNEDPDELATAHVREATVVLPEDMTVNPASADGLQACSSAQIGLASNSPPRFTKAEPSCPLASKLGTVEVETPLLDEPMRGQVYLAAQNDNPFDSLMGIYLVVRGPGLLVKLAGEVSADPGSGRLRTSVLESPQLPFEQLTVRLSGGSRAPLATPRTCGAKTTVANLKSWAGHDVGPESSFEAGAGCASSLAARPFQPGFTAGSANPFAGAHSPFQVRIVRPDGQQELDRVEVTAPEGLVADLSGIPSCSDAQLAAAAAKGGTAEQSSPSCPAASQVGSVLVGAGAGSNPLYVDGKAYLAGPYKGAPLSLAFVTPAVAGPFDLGTVVVRAAVQIDPKTARVSVASDAIPQVLDVRGADGQVNGFPLRIREVRASLDRDAFVLNPTDCSPASVDAKAFGSHGAVASLSSPYRIGGCERLGFKPRLSLRLFGGTDRGDYQGVRAVLRARPGDANIARTVVRMPRSAFLAQEHLNNVCTRVQFAADACPAGSVYGRARAITPILDEPLSGPVYLRSSANPLPDLVAVLRGPDSRPIEVELSGRTDSARKALRTSFDVVPDAPVTRFTMRLFGGKKGLIVNSQDLCGRVRRANVRMTAQNGRRAKLRPVVGNGCRKRAGRS
jgi:hypothetical protein